MQGQFLFIGSICIVGLIVIILILHFIRKFQRKSYRDRIKELELQRNLIESTPVLLELSKVEPIIKNEKLEEKYNRWQERFASIKENKLTLIDDMLIDLDVFVERRDYKNFLYRMAKIEMEIYKAREAANALLDEIRDVTLSEERYRSIVTKLKTKYRTLNKDFVDHKQLYDDMIEAITLQFENIEKRFLDFEKAMEKNEYNEVVHIVKALDTMISHIEIVVNEVPDVLLIAKQIIPNRLKEITYTYNEMNNKGYSLDYLNIEYNTEEVRKNCEQILDKVKVLNLENCMFDLKTMLDYLDSLFIDFEKERLSKKVFTEMNKDFSRKIAGNNKLVKDIYAQLDDIKNMYDLGDNDVEIIDKVNKCLVVINDDYKKLLSKVETKSSPFSMLQKELETLTDRLNAMETDLDKSLKSLGNMYDDEVRAREQLDEIQDFLKLCKTKMRSYKLPIITDNYFVQLSEANEAIGEVIIELEKKPIAIKTLNTRVDTARDLVLKLYNTTNEMIRLSKLTEMAIVYGNRYRSAYKEVDMGLADSQKKFYQGKYKEALDIAIKAISVIEDDIESKLMKLDEANF